MKQLMNKARALINVSARLGKDSLSDSLTSIVNEDKVAHYGIIIERCWEDCLEELKIVNRFRVLGNVSAKEMHERWPEYKPTTEQVLALGRLKHRSKGVELLGPGSDGEFIVRMSGMIVGIEPDGYTHS